MDLPSTLLSSLTLNTEWINDDETWRTILANHFGDERKYMDQVREAVQKEIRGDIGHLNGSTGSSSFGVKKNVWVWLFSVREAKVSFYIQSFEKRTIDHRVSCCSRRGDGYIIEFILFTACKISV